MAVRAFISYSHDSCAHEDRVRALADRLRKDGVDAVLDQYNPAPQDGWPFWSEREIQKADFIVLVCTEIYRRRVEGREEPNRGRGVLWEAKLIYNHLYQADTTVHGVVPILMEGAVDSNIPWPIRGLTSYRVDSVEGYEDFYRHLTGQPRHEKPVLGVLKSLAPSAPQSYPSSLEINERTRPLSSLDQRNRKQMLRHVRLDWIQGVLNQSLYKIARIQPDLTSNSESIEHPQLDIAQFPECSPLQLPSGAKIGQVFDAHAGSLLILGEPGSGKTTQLLELLEELLNRAERDEDYPIPVVFNLSSWAKRPKPLARWLVEELNERSDVPMRVAQRWLEAEQIIPLLDGLDEVVVASREACVEAINSFRRGHGLLPIAVCSRTADYETLATKLRLRIAVIVQPLTRNRVEEYLAGGGEPLRSLGTALDNDPSLWELLRTPLMLWIAMVGCQNAPTGPSHDSLDHRRRRILASFVEAMFKRRSADLPYSQDQTVRWLSALASALMHNRETFFQLEDLSPGWPLTRTQRLISRAGVVFAAGLIGPILGLSHGLITTLIYTVLTPKHTNLARLSSVLGVSVRFGLENWSPVWASIALCFGLAAMFLKLRPTETFRITTVGLSSRLGRAVRTGLLLGTAVWLGLCPLLLSYVKVKELLDERQMQALLVLAGISSSFVSKWVIGLSLGFVVVPTVGLVVALLVLASGEVLDQRRSPNQGTRRSAKTAAAALSILTLSGGLIGALSAGPLFTPRGDMNINDLFPGSILGLAYGLTCGLIIGMAAGGLFSLRHFAVRLAIRISDLAPIRYVRFLDHAVERVFLRKVGGSYLFVHREVMEHFASLAESRGRRQL